MTMNEYEEERQRRIERNQMYMAQLGIKNAAVGFRGRATPSTSTRTGTSTTDDGNGNGRYRIYIQPSEICVSGLHDEFGSAKAKALSRASLRDREVEEVP